MECSVDTVKTNEDCNVMARHVETFGGNLKQRQSFLLYTNYLVYFLYDTLTFAILNYKELENFQMPSGYPRLWYHYPQALT